MLVRGADWLIERKSGYPAKVSVISATAKSIAVRGGRGMTSMLNAEMVAFAYQETRDAKYLDFWREMMAGCLRQRRQPGEELSPRPFGKRSSDWIACGPAEYGSAVAEAVGGRRRGQLSCGDHRLDRK